VTLAAAWILFPALLLLLATGAGLLLDRIAGRRVPGALIPALGMAVIIVGCHFLTLAEWTAGLIVPLAVFLALLGGLLGARRLVTQLDPWAVAVGLGTFAAFAAPIVLSGEATFAGYIKLDDTATWLALTDRLMDAGRSLDGLNPSTYEATLDFNLGDGYPIGVFIPLGVASDLSGEDVAWTIQPYMAALAALLALALWQIAGTLLQSRPMRALVAFVGSQAALLYGYYLWGGVKELAAAALIASAIPLATFAVRRRGSPRSVVPLVVVAAALIATLSGGGGLWLLAAGAGALVLLALGHGLPAAARGAAWTLGLVCAMSLPVLLGGGLLPPTAAPLTSGEATGNLFGSLDPAQVAGIWPSGDFRLTANPQGATYFLIAVVAAVAIGSLALAWRRRAWELPLYVGGSLLACLAICALGSPWIDGKALATASPAIPFAAGLGGAALYASGLRLEGAVLLTAVVAGVLWSNVLQYREVNLAPRDQLAELEEIGNAIGGEGPTLITEYQPYGARHFLRDADPESASELRRHLVPLTNGEALPKGESADTDSFDLESLLGYRSLVLRRAPAQSRPPSPFELAWRGEFYEVWQRSETGHLPVLSHLGLGGESDPVDVPECADVRRLATRAPRGATLNAAAGSAPAVATPARPGEHSFRVHVPRAGDYEVWLEGSVRSRVSLHVDGRPADEVRHQLNNRGLFVRLGAVRLRPGRHELGLHFAGADLRPGTAGHTRSIESLLLTDSDPSEARVVELPAAEGERRLCGRRWDWIELVGA
jgi:hypothetical protein